MQVSFMRMQMQMYVLVMQMSFMRMQMQMYVLVMYEFAPAWACKCSQRMMQMKISCFANVFQEDANANVCACNTYACDAWICPSMIL